MFVTIVHLEFRGEMALWFLWKSLSYDVHNRVYAWLLRFMCLGFFFCIYKMWGDIFNPPLRCEAASKETYKNSLQGKEPVTRHFGSLYQPQTCFGSIAPSSACAAMRVYGVAMCVCVCVCVWVCVYVSHQCVPALSVSILSCAVG